MDVSAELERFAEQRRAMVDSQLRPNAVNDARVVRAMGEVPREAYLPASCAAVAYADVKLPLGAGRTSNPPIATGRLLTEAVVRPSDRVLLIGAAGGYAAAVLAQLCDHVVALESLAELAAAERAALADITHVEVVEGPLEAGWAAGAPYDLVVIDGAVEQVPPAIADQLAPGGRLVTGLIDRGVVRLAAGRRSAGGFGLLDFADVDAAHLPGFAPRQGFVF